MRDIELRWYGDDLLERIKGSTDDALFAGGEELIEHAQSKIRDRSGGLRESGYVATRDRSSYQDDPIHNKEFRPDRKGLALAGFAAFYAHMVEFGTQHHAPVPFLRPALDEYKSAIGRRIVARLGRGLK